MANLRDALITQGPSLEVYRAAQREVARMDALVAELQKRIADLEEESGLRGAEIQRLRHELEARDTPCVQS